MEESILNLPSQFAYKAKIENQDKLISDHRLVVVSGMGGSHLCVGVLRALNPNITFLIHNDYGLPELPDSIKKKTLFVFSSYSGNTEEVIDSFGLAIKEKLNFAVLTTGGTLLELAREVGAPVIVMPDLGIQPRNAIGYSTIALATILKDEYSLKKLSRLEKILDPERERPLGIEIAKTLLNSIPIIYSSVINSIVADSWKRKFNETTKIPSFFNVFPELNHNEMEGFGAIETTQKLSSIFTVYFLMDEDDYPSIQKRMDTTFSIYKKKGVKAYRIYLEGENKAEKIFRGILLADWASLELAKKHYGTDYNNVPIVEEFKKLID